MNMPLNHRGLSLLTTTQTTGLANGPERRLEPRHSMKFPRRPDAGVLSTSIPLFYVGQSRHGFWIVREAEGRSGGIFLCKRSALRFTRKQSEPAAFATMFLAGSFELDTENQGSRVVAALAAAIDIAAHRAPALVDFIGTAAATWRKLALRISRALAGERRNRAAIEKEIFRGQYRLCSKNDDDLPIP
jgi:hypothetical protein